MKRTIYLLFGGLLLLVGLTGCLFFPSVEGSGFLTTSTFVQSGFTKVDAAYGFHVRLVPDAGWSVSVISDDNLVDYIDVHQSNGTLYLTMKFGYNYVNPTLTAEVHMPELNAVALSGASLARLDTGFPYSSTFQLNLSGASEAEIPVLSTSYPSMEVSGASKVTINDLAATSVSANISGASTVTVSGAVGNEDLNVSGSSSAEFLNCRTTTAVVGLSGASRGWVSISGGGTVALNASGASTLYYTGSPTFTVLNMSGGSNVIHLP